jgi:ferrous iron transport protein A
MTTGFIEKNINSRPAEGASYVVTSYHPSNSYGKKKLMALGLTRGTVIRIVRMAPLGDPILLEVRGYRISLRNSELSLLDYIPVGQHNE